MRQGHALFTSLSSKPSVWEGISVKSCQSLRAIQGRGGLHSYLESTQENLHCLCILISIYCIFSSCYLVCGFLSQITQDKDSAVHGSTGEGILRANWKQVKACDSFKEVYKLQTCLIGSRPWTPLVSVGDLVMVKRLDGLPNEIFTRAFLVNQVAQVLCREKYEEKKVFL